MTDPERWCDDPDVGDELRRTLGAAARSQGLDKATQSRVGARLGRLGAVPLSASTFFGLKSAAALGLAGGATVAGAFAVVERYQPAPMAVAAPSADAALHRTPHPARTPHPGDTRERESEPKPLEPAPTAAVPTLNPPSDLSHGARPVVKAPSPSSSGGLGDESALLEQARRALGSAPAAALALVRTHAERFPNGQLAAERRLIEVDALYRVGRRTEARALAERLLTRGGDDLYVGRVERLLEKIRAGE